MKGLNKVSTDERLKQGEYRWKGNKVSTDERVKQGEYRWKG